MEGILQIIYSLNATQRHKTEKLHPPQLFIFNTVQSFHSCKCQKTCLRYEMESMSRKTEGIKRTAKQKEMVKSLIGGNLIHSLVLETVVLADRARGCVSSSHRTSQGNSCLKGRAVSGQASWSHFCWFGPLWVHSPTARKEEREYEGLCPSINLEKLQWLLRYAWDSDSLNTLDSKHLLRRTMRKALSS